MDEKTIHFKNCLGVFQGGGCKAIAFVGAYKESYERGVHFSEVAGTSAGSIFAALIAAGATPEKLIEIIGKTKFEDFNGSFDKSLAKFGFKIGWLRHISYGMPKSLVKICNYLGLFSSNEIENWLNNHLQELLKIGNRNVQFKDLKLPLHVVATDVVNRQQKIWNTINTPEDDVAYAVRCSCSIPIYFQPVDMRYVDGGLVSNLPSFSLAPDELHFEKVLCFTLSEKITDIKDIKDYFGSLVGAVIDGAMHIQGLLQENLYHIKIKDLPVTTTEFEKLDEKVIAETIEKGRNAASEFFFNETHNVSKNLARKSNLSRDMLLNSIVTIQPKNFSKIAICFKNTRLVYQLFPSIMSWVANSVSITFITLNLDNISFKRNEEAHEKYRRLMLENMGIQVITKLQLPFEGVLFDSSDDDFCKSILFYDEDLVERVGHGKIYQGIHDYIVHKNLWHSLDLEQESNALNFRRFEIIKVSEKDISDKIKEVKQYQAENITVSLQTVKIGDMRAVTKYVKSYKYNQIDKIFNSLKKANIDLFEPAAIKLTNGTIMLITPPVLEKHADNYVLLEGNSRINHCFRDLGLTEVKAIVVENVSIPLPSSDLFEISEMIITTQNKVGQTRYNDFDYSKYRKIEETVRAPEQMIKELK